MFANLEQKSSIHPIKRLAELRSEAVQSGLLANPLVNADILELNNKDAKNLVEKLRDLYLVSVNEVENAQNQQNSLLDKVLKLGNELEQAEEEKERFKDLFVAEIKKKNDLRNFIYNQKRLKQNSNFASKYH